MESCNTHCGPSPALKPLAARSRPEAGSGTMKRWLERRKLEAAVNPQEQESSPNPAGCHIIFTVLSKDKLTVQQVHNSSLALQKVERDFRAMKTGLLEVGPVFVRKESRTRGHVCCRLLALKPSREPERRLSDTFGTTGQMRHATTLPGALASLTRLSLLLDKIDDKTTVSKLPQSDEAQRMIVAAVKVSLPVQ